MPATQWIRAGFLIDGTGGAVKRDQLLGIENGLISGIAPAGAGIPAGRRVLDYSRHTLLPCLVDCHVHLAMSGTIDPETRRFQLDASYEALRETMERHLAQHLACGVVGVRDGGDREGRVLRCLREHGNPSGVTVRAAGRAWHRAGRYGRLIGKAVPEGRALAVAIRKELASIDHLKIINSGLNSLSVFGRETPPQFGQAELTRAAVKATDAGKPVMVHANGRAPVAAAVAAGCNSIEHGFFMGRENLERMARQQVAWVPTACTMQAYAACLRAGSREADIARSNLDHQLEQMAYAVRAGVCLALGTDAGSLGVEHGLAVAAELGLFMEAGATASQAVKFAAANGARLLRLDEPCRLERGLPATFMIVAGEPSDLAGNLGRPLALYRRGVPSRPIMPDGS